MDVLRTGNMDEQSNCHSGETEKCSRKLPENYREHPEEFTGILSRRVNPRQKKPVLRPLQIFPKIWSLSSHLHSSLSQRRGPSRDTPRSRLWGQLRNARMDTPESTMATNDTARQNKQKCSINREPIILQEGKLRSKRTGPTSVACPCLPLVTILRDREGKRDGKSSPAQNVCSGKTRDHGQSGEYYYSLVSGPSLFTARCLSETPTAETMSTHGHLFALSSGNADEVTLEPYLVRYISGLSSTFNT